VSEREYGRFLPLPSLLWRRRRRRPDWFVRPSSPDPLDSSTPNRKTHV